MRRSILYRILMFAVMAVISCHASAQGKFKVSKKKKVQAASTVYVPGPLFSSDSLLQLKFTGKLRELFRDRKDDAIYHPALLQYHKKDGSLSSIGIQAITRGHFRRLPENCELPPLLININKSAKLKNTLFEKQEKLKLVMPCVDDNYVVNEYLVYKMYNLFTPLSFKARLARVEFIDSLQKRKTETHYCILVEDEKTLGRRNGYMVGAAKRSTRPAVDQEAFLLTSLFEFMIGNTDWSVEYLHNIKLLYKDSSAKPATVPYDFDHCGIVNAPYAHPAEELGLESVRERMFYGNCVKPEEIGPVLNRFKELKEKIYTLYSTCAFLDAKSIRSATGYLDEFYKIIDNPKSLEKYLSSACSTKQRVVIKGYD